jgi:hypothetical protein
MTEEYIIINRTAIQQRIEELKKYSIERNLSTIEFATYNHTILELKEILSQSTLLIPEIEKAFYGGQRSLKEKVLPKKTSQDYISNLKLDI